ncbi:MAG: alkyl hydroperoxide reductase [Phycisphaerae bacterium]
MPLLPDPLPDRIPEPRRTWYRRVFYIAAVYNLLWGVGVILFPRLPFELGGLPMPDDIGILFWQCIGMFVLVFALGYYYAAREPERYAPFILIATLGKVFGPIGFLYGWLWLGVLPGEVGLTILTNDLVWWPVFIPFVLETFRRRPAGRLAAGGVAA